jgi:molybdopterin molybdotransferase
MEVFISVEKARSICLEAVSLQPVQKIPFEEALDHTLAQDMISRDNIPPFANSAMDGYAVRTEDFYDLPARLHVLGDVPAGSAEAWTVESGNCVKIMTGAPFPAGADAVAPVEWTSLDDRGRVLIERKPEKGAHVRPAGQDVREGERVFAAGERVTPPVVGMLATLGMHKVAVRQPPRVAVVATGDELIEAGELLAPGKIRNSSGAALRAQVRKAGGLPLAPLLARDNERSIREVLEKALEADVLVLAGGVSVGDYDLVKQVLDAMGMKMHFWKVRQRPGKPLAFGMLKGKPVFGLPGNPVSSAMCFEQYVRPALARMLGRREVVRPLHPAVLDTATLKVKGLHFFARGIASYDPEGRLLVRDTGPQASNLYSSVVRANCIFHMPEELEHAPAGTAVQLEWLTW